MVDYKANAIAYLDEWLEMVEQALTEDMRKKFKVDGAKIVRSFWEIGLLTEKEFYKYHKQLSRLPVVPMIIDGSRELILRMSQEDCDCFLPDDEDESES